MKRIIVAIFLIFSASVSVFSTPPEKENDKVMLSYLDLNDTSIEFVAFDIHSMILRKSKGFLWPAVKFTFSKEDEKLIFVATAIDNSWCNMFVPDETPHGYFTMNGRLFIVATKGDVFEEFNKFFTLDETVEKKSFYKADEKTKPVAKNPIWTYLYRGEEMATVLKSSYTENLGR